MLKGFFLIVFLVSSGFSFNMDGEKEDYIPISQKKYSEIINYLETEGKKGSGESYFYLSQFYLNGSPDKDKDGVSIEKNIDIAEDYLIKSSETYPLGAMTLGGLYLYNPEFIIKENNIEKSKKYLEIAINNGLFEAHTLLADIYFNFTGEAEKAIESLSIAAENNVATAQYALAVIYNKGLKSETINIEKNDLISSRYLTDACENPKKTQKITDLCFNNQLVVKEKIK